MTHSLTEQIQDWVESVEEISITSKTQERLGSLSDDADANHKEVDAFTFRYDVDGIKVSGFLIAPKKCHKKLSVILYNRGGTADFGLVTNGFIFTRLADLARQGYMIIGSQYPGNQVSEGYDERGGKSDIQSVLRLHDLIKHLDAADDASIGMYGESRGGMMTYQCVARVSWIKAALTVGGLTNLDRSMADRPEMREVFEKHFGNTDKNRDARSAVKWAHLFNKATPICLLHGAADTKVDVRDSLELAEKLSEVKHPYALHVIMNGDHTLKNVQKERDAIIQEWFDRHLKMQH